MKRKNLEKAIIMSLLAASISVPVWAEDVIVEGEQDSGIKITNGKEYHYLFGPEANGDVTYNLDGSRFVEITRGDGKAIIDGNSLTVNQVNSTSGDYIVLLQENAYLDINMVNDININGNSNTFSGVYVGQSSKLDIDSEKGNIYIYNKGQNGVQNTQNSQTSIKALQGVVEITADAKNLSNALVYGVFNSSAYISQNENGDKDHLSISGDQVKINAIGDNVNELDTIRNNITTEKSMAITDITAQGDITVTAQSQSGTFQRTVFNEKGNLNLISNEGSIVLKSNSGSTQYNYGIQNQMINNQEHNTGNVLLHSQKDIVVDVTTQSGYAYGVMNDVRLLNQSAETSTELISDDGKIIIKANSDNSGGYGIWANNSDITHNNIITLSSTSNSVEATTMGVVANGVTSEVKLNANNGDNTIQSSKSSAVYAYSGALIDLNANNNYVYANKKAEDVFGASHAIKAFNSSTVNLNATAGDNMLAGVIYAKDAGTVVTLDHNIIDENGNVIKKGSGSNIIRSSAHGSEAEGRNHVVAALYAQNNGTIDIKAGEDGVNYIATDFSFEHADDSERTIWAQQGGKINIEGQTYIIASNADKYTENVAGNARGIAITAGSETIPTEGIDTTNDSIIYIEDELRSHVKLAYNGSDSGLHSFIKGDIVSGYGGLVDVYNTDNSGLDMMGNALAANGGKLNLDIGNGGTWYGRADDYGDAGVVKDGEHTTFFNPAFSNEIVQGGQVNLTMGEGSRWNVTGQSWITSINTGNSDIAAGTPIIDLVNANTDRNETAHALTVYELDGNAIFNMSLDGNRDVSDMLYIKNADGEYVINVVDAVSVDDMYQDGFDGLRFATIGDGSNVSFRAITYNQGINNVEYEVGQDEYDGNEENNAYNSSETDGGMSSEKPGSDMVDDFFDSTGTPENPQGPDDTEIMTLENTVESDSNVNGTTNFKLIGVKNSEISDGGKTVVNMSKVNYSNAVYMDRLNKRLGEARYINNEEDQGMWVRMRHDRIGKDNEFRIMNTMYELGYDEKQECDNGERRVGAAIDYMDGSSEYTGVGGSGDVSRKGIWLYDTWLGDKGHYSDFVAKWGHLSNDFTLYRGGDKITGDFSNNVYSISAEYGRKKDIGNNWYFEPQVQLQYARVTDANYTTSQGTEVSLDAINSLIARAGFRLGKDLGERSTVYFKADLLHEFLGDQDIYAHDKTGTMDVTYGNEGTWCDIGFGFATAMSKTSYAYLDVETSLGNDYEETYQINAGLQWSF